MLLLKNFHKYANKWGKVAYRVICIWSIEGEGHLNIEKWLEGCSLKVSHCFSWLVEFTEDFYFPGLAVLVVFKFSAINMYLKQKKIVAYRKNNNSCWTSKNNFIILLLLLFNIGGLYRNHRAHSQSWDVRVFFSW